MEFTMDGNRDSQARQQWQSTQSVNYFVNFIDFNSIVNFAVNSIDSSFFKRLSRCRHAQWPMENPHEKPEAQFFHTFFHIQIADLFTGLPREPVRNRGALGEPALPLPQDRLDVFGRFIRRRPIHCAIGTMAGLAERAAG